VTDLLEQAALLALVSHSRQQWHTIATLVEEAGSAIKLLHGEQPQLNGVATRYAEPLSEHVAPHEIDHYADQIKAWTTDGVRLLTVLDDDYPANLREVYNHPPFLFVRGRLVPDDTRAIAVVGTRHPSEDGVAQAQLLAGDLAKQRVTVVSGMALGIDTAAHQAALDARGRTLAVFGTGINRLYPAANQDLAARILQQGAQLSQFWPDAPPTKSSFPMRNVVTSGLALGTVVVEAHGTSGASMQARLCLEHGRHLFLLRRLVAQEDWARRYARRAGVTVIDTADEVLAVVDEVLDPPEQLSFS
jgi:DNA processing protein